MSPVGHGFELRCMGAKEATYGQAIARTRSIELISESLAEDSPPNKKGSLRGFQPRAHFPATRKPSGDLVAELFFEGHERFLEAAFGQIATAELEASTRWKHTFTPTKLLPSLSLEIGRDIATFLYTGVKVNAFALNLVPDQLLQATYSVLAQDEDPEASPTADAHLAEKLAAYYHAVMTIDATPFDVAEFNWNLTNNLADARFRNGTRLRKEPVRNEMGAFEGSFMADFEAIAEYLKFKNSTEFALVLKLTGPALGAGNYEIELTLPKCVYTGSTPVVGGAAVIPEEFPFECYAADDLSVPAATLAVTNSIETPL